MLGKKQKRIMAQFETIMNHENEIFSLPQIRELFGLGETCALRDTWMYQRGFLINVEHGVWKIRRSA